MENFCVAKQ